MPLIKISARILTAIAGTGLLLTLFSFGVWPLETASLWIPWYLFLGLLGGCGCAVSRSYRWAGAGALCAAVAGAMMMPHYLPAPRPDTARPAPVLRLLQANVYCPGNDPKPLLDLIRETRPDIILLQEVDEKWRGFLKPLEELYPHSRYSPRYTNGGPALAQFWSAETVSIEDLHPVGLPATETVLRVNGGSLCVLNAHTAAPFTRDRAERYRNQMDLLARHAATRKMPVVLAGDLNAGVWSRHFTALLDRGGLVSARRGFGGLGTWPSFLGPLRIALDHLLVSPGIRVVDCRVGPGIGSDHRPLLTDLYAE